MLNLYDVYSMRMLTTPKTSIPRFTVPMICVLKTSKFASNSCFLITLSKVFISKSKCLLTCLALSSVEVLPVSISDFSIYPKLKNYILLPPVAHSHLSDHLSQLFWVQKIQTPYQKARFCHQQETLPNFIVPFWFLVVFSKDSIWSVDFNLLQQRVSEIEKLSFLLDLKAVC